VTWLCCRWWLCPSRHFSPLLDTQGGGGEGEIQTANQYSSPETQPLARRVGWGLKKRLLLVSCNYRIPPPSYFLRTILQTFYTILPAVNPMFLQQRRHFQFPTHCFSLPKIDIFNDFQRRQLLNHSLQLRSISIFKFRTTFRCLSIPSA
jgi:hypothetical protein